MYDTITLPSQLCGFEQSDLPENANSFIQSIKGKHHFTICGCLPQMDLFDTRCCKCGREMHGHGYVTERLAHIPLCSEFIMERFDSQLNAMVPRPVRVYRTDVCVTVPRYRCPCCNQVVQARIRFKAPSHRITQQLYDYVSWLLTRDLTLTKVANITGLSINTVREIDKERLTRLYTINGELRRPEQQAETLAIDEFKLHDGHQYATIIMDADTKHVLFVSQGKSMDVVTRFLEFVGRDWMLKVKAVACDMNAGFCNEFKRHYPHLKIVFDRFHVMKHFNEDVIGGIRKDEQERLTNEGRHGDARRLKNARWILTANPETLARWDGEAARQQEGEILDKVGGPFKLKEHVRRSGYTQRLEALLQENALLMTADIIKEKLRLAYEIKVKFDGNTQTVTRVYDCGNGMKLRHNPGAAEIAPRPMRDEITEIIAMCQDSGNCHLKKFGKLLENHLEGIVTHESTNISSGVIEGFNNKIKTLRRSAYGYNDDEYFFLKIIDISRTRD